MVTPESVGLSSERLARIRPAVEKHIGDDKIAGALTLLARRGELVHLECYGLLERETKRPMRPETIFRLFSMTKPITCVGLMMLYEQGRFQLFDPVSKFIPAFKELKVCTGGSAADPVLDDLAREVTVRDLLCHTSGLTYHWLEYGPVEALYREMKDGNELPLSEFVAELLRLPLALQPGTAWRYGLSHDVAAHLIEILSDRPLDTYMQERLFEPLGMVDTGYFVPQEKLDRLAAMYGSGDIRDPETTVIKWFGAAMMGVNELLADPRDCPVSKPHEAFRGGHGLTSTAADYLRFCQMLLNNGELEGTRILGRKTIELMTTNHLPAALLPYEMAGIPSPGFGYGLGFKVLMDLGQCQGVGSEGEYGWGGGASTSFWIDPREELIGIQMAQFQPSGYHAIRDDFRATAYQAIVD